MPWQAPQGGFCAGVDRAMQAWVGLTDCVAPVASGHAGKRKRLSHLRARKRWVWVWVCVRVFFLTGVLFMLSPRRGVLEGGLLLGDGAGSKWSASWSSPCTAVARLC